MSEEIFWQVFNQSCSPVLLYGLESVYIYPEQTNNLPVVLNIAVKRCFHIARNISIRNVLYFVGSMPEQMLLDERKVQFIKSLGSGDVLRLCARMNLENRRSQNMCCKHDVHCELSVCAMNDAFKYHLLNTLRDEGFV